MASLCIDDSPVSLSMQVKSLGIIFGNTLSFEAHINNVTRTAYFHIYIA